MQLRIDGRRIDIPHRRHRPLAAAKKGLCPKHLAHCENDVIVYGHQMAALIASFFF